MSQPKRPDHAVTISHRVGFQECDPLGVVWHGRYLEWLEAARNALFGSIDLDIPQIRALGHRMYVVEAKCRYMAPLTYGDVAQITSWFGKSDALIKVSYDVRHERTSRWCARATTTLAVTDHEGNLLGAIPKPFRSRMPK